MKPFPEAPVRQRGRPMLPALLLLAAFMSFSCARQVSPAVQKEALPPAEGAPPPAAPIAGAAGPGSAGAELQRAEAELDQARAELEASLPIAFAGAPAPAAAPSREARDEGADIGRTAQKRKSGEASRGAAAAPKSEAESAAANDERDKEDTCERSCKAFASLERAKSAICRLDTPGGARCGRAEDIVRDAQTRISACSCPR